MTRRSQLDEILEAEAATALVVVAESARDPDLAPWVGPVHLHSTFLVAPAGRPPTLGYLTPMERDEAAATGLELLDPEQLGVADAIRGGASDEELWAAVVERGLTDGPVPRGTILLAGHAAAGIVGAVIEHLEAAGWVAKSGLGASRALRRDKTPAMARGVREAAEGAVTALRRVAELLTHAGVRAGELWLEGERLTPGRLRREIALVLAARGLEQPEGNIVAAGAEGAVPHTAGDDRRPLRAGESLVVDLYPKGWLFADCTRTFCVGEAPAELLAAHGAVDSALRLATREARAGRVGWDLQEAVCAQLAVHGYPTPVSDPGTTRGYVHGLGHGVGFELHELPTFRRDADDAGRLAPGDVVTLEPGLYDPEAGYGVRLEDLFLVGPEGELENLTPLPYALDPRAW